MSSVSSDLLTAASLLTALIAIFFALWSPDINAALKTEVPTSDKHLVHKEISKVLWWQSVPLCIASIALTGTLVPPAVAVVVEAVKIADVGHYDAVKACYIVMIVLLLGLTFLTIATVVQLTKHANSFK
jgi:hypothetical protein